ncbi:MAG: hypothetical protein U0790_10140 [Isosphaeraceae bacterium]
MSGWMWLWTIVLLGALTMFSGLTVAVTIGGFLDIRKMLSTIRRQHEAADAGPGGTESD